MRKVKILGPITIVAVFAMALLSPSLAMGESTSLCSADETPCSSPITHIHYVDDDLEVLTGFMNYHCDALFLASISELGAPQVLEGEFTYTNCSSGCIREEVNGPTILNLLKTGHESAKVVGTEGSGIFSFCGESLECVYLFENLIGSAKGPLLSTENHGEITYANQPLTHSTESGFLCPKEAKLDAKFVPLSSAYISS